MKIRWLLAATAGAVVSGYLLLEGWPGGTPEPPAPAPPAVTSAPAEPEPVIETIPRDLRDVTPSDIVQLPRPSGPLVRLPAVDPPPPRKPREKPKRGEPVQVVAAGILEVEGRTTRLAGISPVAPEEICAADTGNWPCGAFARTAFQRYVRRRLVVCEDSGAGDSALAFCRIAGHDIAGWLVEQGWARAADPRYAGSEEEARKAGRGIWGNGPAPLPEFTQPAQPPAAVAVPAR